MSEHEEQLAAMRAAMDQAVAAAGEMAKAMWGYYETMVKEGFTIEQAFQLTRDWQKTLLGQKPESDE
jgi:hypothetical protein